MGDPRKLHKKYETPRKVWDSDRIKKEGKLSSSYGLKNTREVWTMLQELKKARRNAIRNISLGKEGEDNAKPLLLRLARLGILPADAKLDDVLSISVEHFLDRRLQTRVMKKGLANTPAQARQLITHGFISIKGKKVTIPSYMVTAEEEQWVAYYRPIDISVHEPKPKEKAAAPSEEAPAAPAEAAKQ